MTISRMEGDNLILEYDLFELPTAQHKAGLAGLLILARSMTKRGLWKGADPSVAPTTVQFAFTEEGLQAIFDELYDAHWVDPPPPDNSKKSVRKKKGNVSSLEVDEGKPERRLVPRGSFLAHYFPDGDGLWLKLWREMIWGVLRSRYKARLVYEDRANGSPSQQGPKWWNSLGVGVEKPSSARAEHFASSFYLGAQDENAERVPFKGSSEETFLLHFWPVAASVFAPKRLTIKRDPQQGLTIKRDDAGYVLVVPEPANLKHFVDAAIAALRSLEVKAAGYRPESAVIDVPEEGGMEYLYHLARVRAVGGEAANTLTTIELYHLEKPARSNNVKMHTSERIAPSREAIRRYESLRGQWSNPLFKAVGLANLLADVPWYRGFDALFVEHPWQIFVYVGGQTPREIRFFGSDVRRKMKAIESDQEILRKGGVMAELDRADQLAVRVYQLVKNYVNFKTEEKSGKKYKDFKKEKGQDGKERILYPVEYREAREKICSDAFLGIRGRRDKEFVEYFTGTLCSVPQFLREAEFVAVALALANDWESVKTLTMLALSAASYLPGSIDDPKEAA